jgi:serine phosphatase RsbU (regulator of sigma subunit)
MIAQARTRQELLARQTAKSIEDFYAGIFDNLDLIREAEETGGATTRSVMPVGPGMANVLWVQLRDRVSHLASFNPNERTDRPPATRPAIEERPPRQGGRFGDIADRFERYRRQGPEMLGSPTDESIALEDITAATRELLKQHIDGEPFVSSMLHLGSQEKAVTLVVIPPAERRFPRVLVAVVPVDNVEERFAEARKGREGTLAVLRDRAHNAVAASDRSLVGKNVGEKELGRSLASSSRNTIVTSEALRIRGAKWTLVVDSPLTEVNAIVSELFRKAFFWTVFVIVAFAAILTSTAIFMIRNRIRLENQRTALITKQLADARAIQLAWLPGHAKTAADVEIAATNQPAQHISGDFYNWFEVSPSRMVVLIGDVTGHGMSAAFLMATTQLLVRTTFPRVNDPGRCLEEVNRQLCVQAFNGQFVTMLLMVIDTSSNQIELAVAGHPPPLVSSGHGFEPLSLEPQLVLGVDRDATFTTERFSVGEGAAIVLYTDGVQDAYGPDGERFGTQRLIDALSRFKPDSAQAALQTIVSAVNEHRAGEPLGDDLTLVTIQLQPESAAVPAG